MRAGGRLLLALLISTGALPCRAAELLDGDLFLALSPSVRVLYTQSRRLSAERLLVDGSTSGRPSTGLLLTRLRLDLEAAYRDLVSARVVYDNQYYTGPGLDSLAFQLGKELSFGTWFDWDDVITDRENGYWEHLLYRAWVRFQGERYELTLGRQRIALGRGRVWNPTDLFNPIPPLQIQGDQRIGQDAAVLRVLLVPRLWGVAIWSPEDDPDEHRTALRLEFSSMELDASGMLARIAEDWVYGVDFARDVRGAGLRGEATYTHLDAGGDIWQATLSLDYTFGIGTGLYGLVEYFYNENRISGDLGEALGQVVPPGGFPSVDVGIDVILAAGEALIPAAPRLATSALHNSGVSLGYDLTPLLRGSLLWLQDWNGGSAALVPTLGYSPNDHVELRVGAQLFLGSGDDTSYGEATNVLFVEVDLFY